MTATLPRCDGWCRGANPITHIGSKGYVYCAECARERRWAGSESVRKMRAWELDRIARGHALNSYAPITREESDRRDQERAEATERP